MKISHSCWTPLEYETDLDEPWSDLRPSGSNQCLGHRHCKRSCRCFAVQGMNCSVSHLSETFLIIFILILKLQQVLSQFTVFSKSFQKWSNFVISKKHISIPFKEVEKWSLHDTIPATFRKYEPSLSWSLFRVYLVRVGALVDLGVYAHAFSSQCFSEWNVWLLMTEKIKHANIQQQQGEGKDGKICHSLFPFRDNKKNKAVKIQAQSRAEGNCVFKAVYVLIVSTVETRLVVVFADEKKICTTSVVVNVEKSTRPSPHLQLLNIVVSELDKILLHHRKCFVDCASAGGGTWSWRLVSVMGNGMRKNLCQIWKWLVSIS